MAEEPGSNGRILANGHTKLSQVVGEIEDEIYQEENIFLFLPNLIGESGTMRSECLH